ncbi:MAG: putative 2-aminoethylphosphonate ABC transporter ATP-binding protein [Candidatus Accumulibacter sp.]|jgi:iron(III) transport system ATP-binding protein|nr:putative 2-aminoethylphosphonate ABC transporter ATP-binding protein [Accumulibacter sp.]
MHPPKIYQNVPTPLKVLGVSKSFRHIKVLEDISLDIGAGELVCLLGASGCGKTTLLRIIAGLERQDRGEIFMGRENISRAPPQARDYGILFQSYALFPNLTVEKNVAYGFSGRKFMKSEVRARCREILEMVGLEETRDSYPDQLSGGQQQRVAMARALAPSPTFLLLDEPMSALDAKVRERLRGEIRRLQKRLGITTIMVTHDQDEAMTMADRIAVMNEGRIEQFDTPENIYHRPATPFVADFIGHANWLPCRGIRAGRAALANASLAVEAPGDFGQCTLFCRPEDVVLFHAPREDTLPGRIVERTFLGSKYRLALSLDALEEADDRCRVLADVSGAACVEPGDPVWIHVPGAALRIFASPLP